MIGPLLSYLPLLALTLLIECALVAAAAPRALRRRAITACLALNLLTEPLATLLSWRLGAEPVLPVLLAFCCEWLGYARLLDIPTGRALRLALPSNLCSAAASVGVWFATAF
ncbi:MAG: hypothetical protein U1E73_03705 [Planctomycetota bacterium]